MDLGNITAAKALDAVVSAWADAAGDAVAATATTTAIAIAGGDAPQAPVPGGFVERMLGETQAQATQAPPGAPADNSAEAAGVQTFARPHAPVSEPLRPADTALPSAAHSHSEFAIPADQLVPVTLVGLQVEAAWLWRLPQRGVETTQAAADEPRAPAVETPPLDDEDHDRHEAAESPEHDDEARIDTIVEDAHGTDWCEPLSLAVRTALALAAPAPALLAAAGEWRRGRCVVLACPQGADPAGPAWAFVLWPRRRSLGAAHATVALWAQRLALSGLRVDARLQWSALPHAAAWRHVRLVKDHHPRRGRQLLALDAATVVPCAVQLGPVLALAPRRCEVCVRIDAVCRFWNALAGQWSVQVLVGAQPLPGVRAGIVELSC